MTSHTISNAYMMLEMSVNEYEMMRPGQRSSVCHPSDPTNLINDEQHEKRNTYALVNAMHHIATTKSFPGTSIKFQDISSSCRHPLVL